MLGFEFPANGKNLLTKVWLKILHPVFRSWFGEDEAFEDLLSIIGLLLSLFHWLHQRIQGSGDFSAGIGVTYPFLTDCSVTWWNRQSV